MRARMRGTSRGHVRSFRRGTSRSSPVWTRASTSFAIFGLESGEAHILRNAGGIVSEDVLRSLVLSQGLLQTREIILMHHTDCGMKFDDVDEAVRTAMRRVREHPHLPHRDNVRGFVYEVEHGRVREVT